MEQQLKEDQKQFRKLRKLLRQIEHLELLTRQLNEEEEEKVARRDEYRLRLIELTSSYKPDELINLIDENETTETIANQEDEDQEEEIVATPPDEVNELVEKFEKMGQIEDVLVENEQEKKVKEEEEKKPKKKKKSSKSAYFDTLTNSSIHVDLITAVDIDPNFDLIVTGRYILYN